MLTIRKATRSIFCPRSVKKMGVNNLFVPGRVIYQAGCGGSNCAIAYVS